MTIKKPIEPYIVCSHLLNNYTGSPFVLSQVVETLVADGQQVNLYIANKKGDGFLTNLNARYYYSFYKFKQNKILRLFYVMGAEWHLFLKIMVRVKKADCKLIYANTLYSFGAALAGKLRGIKVIYHIHETSLKPALLKQFLVAVARFTSSKNIYVSKCHMQSEHIKGIPSVFIYNCLDKAFYDKALATQYTIKPEFVVLMICSLKDYKGVNEFVQIADALSENPVLRFKLVLNASKNEIDQYFNDFSLPANIAIFDSQKELIPFYTEASLVLNLSRPDQWVETFGLTLLEAMTFGIPVIAPPVGGPTELVAEGENGYLLSCYELEKIAEKIIQLSQNPELCLQLSAKAREKAREYSPDVFKTKILDLINE